MGIGELPLCMENLIALYSLDAQHTHKEWSLSTAWGSQAWLKNTL